MGKHSAPSKREQRRRAASAPAAPQNAEVAEPITIDSADPKPAPNEVVASSTALDPTPTITAVVAAGATPLSAARGASMRRMPRRIAIGAAIAMLVAGTVGFIGLGKSVTVVVDGKPVSVTTYASDVEGVLHDAGVSTKAKDDIEPAPSTTVSDGDTVDVVRAREVTLDIDGTATTRWVTALTASGALHELGLDDHEITGGDEKLPLSGASVDVSAPKQVTIVIDGGQQQITSAGATVQDVLDDASITLGDQDQTDPALDARPTAGMTITVTRNETSTIVEERDLPFTTIEQSNPDQYVGIDSVATQGVNGKAKVTVEVTSVNGTQVSKTDVGTEVVTAPVDQVVLKGAKEFPADVNAMNWDALAMCESTMNPKAVNKTNGKYFGMYQFSVETWAGVGGTGNPADAPVDEQTARAKILFMKYGASQWECGSHLYD